VKKKKNNADRAPQVYGNLDKISSKPVVKLSKKEAGLNLCAFGTPASFRRRICLCEALGRRLPRSRISSLTPLSMKAI
jgi:hypothetical protein